MFLPSTLHTHQHAVLTYSLRGMTVEALDGELPVNGPGLNDSGRSKAGRCLGAAGVGMVQQEAERRGIRRFKIVFDESATMQKLSEEAGTDNEEVDEDRDESVGRGGRRSKQPVASWYELHELRPYIIKHAITRELGPVERRKRATRSVEAATPTRAVARIVPIG
eukprot:COSAG05_NODE_1_length_66591_cov_307.301581_42_plen_165_part_00